jgi:hypothetical protein
MAITNKLKPLLDQPVWEWTRFNVTPEQRSAMTTANGGPNRRYLYNLNGTNFTRFDTYTDAFQLLQTPVTAPVSLVDITYKGYDGYYSNAIFGTTTTIAGSFIDGGVCKGKKIRILEGPNDGQERTITDVSAPIIVDPQVVTTSVNTNTPVSITDGNKQWIVNQWKGYQFRIISGNGKGVVKRIIYNNANTLFFADVNYLGIEPRMSYTPFKASPSSANDATRSIGVIEYQVATLDSALPVNPTIATKYMVLGGAIWTASASGSAPFYSLQVYDILSDEWYQKSTYSSYYLSQLGGTSAPPFSISLERIGEYAGAYLSGGSVTSATLRTITDTALNLTPERYTNYQVRLSDGQTRAIKSHTNNTITFYRDLDSIPANGTTFEIFADNDKIYLSGGGLSTLLYYSIQRDAWSHGEIHDSGNVRNIAISSGNEASIPITSINFTASAGAYGVPGAVGFATVTTTINHRFKNGDLITVRGVTQSEYNRVNVAIPMAVDALSNSTTLRYVLTSTPSDTTINNNDASNCIQPSATVMPDVAKNWTTNEHRGKILFVSNNALGATTNARLIYSNTSNTLTTFGFPAAHAINAKYHIQDLRALGATSGLGTRNNTTLTGNIISGTNIITGVTNAADIKIGSPLLTNSPSMVGAITTAVPYLRVTGVDIPNNTVFVNSNATATGAVTAIVDETLTNGWGVATNTSMAVFRQNDIPISISSLSWSANVVTATTTEAHGYTTGDLVSIRGVSVVSSADVTYMRTLVPITVTGATTFTYAAANTPTNATATAATAGNSTTVLVDGQKNWAVNCFAGMRCKIIAGTGAGQEFTINSNTNNTLSFSAITTAPDRSSVYAIYPVQPRGVGHFIRYAGNTSDSNTTGKYLISVRANNTSTIEKLNITTNEWEIVDPQPLSIISDTFGPGTVGAYDGKDKIYIQKNTTHRFVSIDVNTNEVVPYGQAPNPTTPSTILAGNKCEIVESEDGLKYLYFQANGSVEMYRTLIFV